MNRSALAIVAHPDDIEFLFAGTMLQLAKVGFELHYMCVANGCCGSLTAGPQETAAVRRAEAERAAALLGAVWHPPLCNDLEIVYSTELLRRLAATVREVRPAIVFTHSPDDYMVDHMETARLATAAAFTHGIPNFATAPPSPALEGHRLAVYHAMPHGLCDGLRRKVTPAAFVDTTSVIGQKRAALASHESQHAWLEASQGMSSYLASMEEMSRELGRMSGRFEHAEGWRRRPHFGLSPEDDDPLADALGELYQNNPEYELGG